MGNLVYSLPQPSSGDFYKITAFVTGTKKRCRKQDFHSFTVGYIPFAPPSSETLTRIERIAMDIIDREMKSFVGKIRLTLDFTSFDEGIMTWEPFNGNNIKLQVGG